MMYEQITKAAFFDEMYKLATYDKVALPLALRQGSQFLKRQANLGNVKKTVGKLSKRTGPSKWSRFKDASHQAMSGPAVGSTRSSARGNWWNRLKDASHQAMSGPAIGG